MYQKILEFKMNYKSYPLSSYRFVKKALVVKYDDLLAGFHVDPEDMEMINALKKASEADPNNVELADELKRKEEEIFEKAYQEPPFFFTTTAAEDIKDFE